MPQWLEVLIAVGALALGGSGIAGLVSAIQARRTVRSAARKVDIEALTATITILQTENGRLCLRMRAIEDDSAKRKADIKALDAKLNEVEAENVRLRLEVDEVKRENCRLRVRVEELEKENQTLRSRGRREAKGGG